MILQVARLCCRQALDVCGSVRVIDMEKNRDKAVGKKQKATKPPGFRRFKKLLKRVISAPPLRQKSRGDITERPPSDMNHAADQE
jgi:hypothetical protein